MKFLLILQLTLINLLVQAQDCYINKSEFAIDISNFQLLNTYKKEAESREAFFTVYNYSIGYRNVGYFLEVDSLSNYKLTIIEADSVKTIYKGTYDYSDYIINSKLLVGVYLSDCSSSLSFHGIETILINIKGEVFELTSLDNELLKTINSNEDMMGDVLKYYDLINHLIKLQLENKQK